MTKENKGKIVLDLSGDLQYKLDVEYDYEHDCGYYGCDEEGICRCGILVNTEMKPVDAYRAVTLAQSFFKEGEGEEGNFGFVLSVRFLKHFFSNIDDMFEIRTCSGYYGDEIDGVFVKPGTEQELQRQTDVFNSMSNSDRVKHVLEMEYGHLLPEIEKYDLWQLVEVAVEDVKADKNVLEKCSTNIVNSYSMFTPWYCISNRLWKTHSSWFPGIVAIPKNDQKYRVVDGFHRYKAWVTKPYGLGQQKWKQLKLNKKIKIITPVV